MRRRITGKTPPVWRPLVAVALAVCVAGCGDGAGADEYRDAAERICSTADADSAKVPAPTDSAASVAAYSAAVLPIRRREANALRRLDAPEELSAQHEELVSAADAIVDALATLRQAARQGSRAGAEIASQQGERARMRAAEAASALGLEACRQ